MKLSNDPSGEPNGMVRVRNLNLDATTVNDRQGKYKRTSIKLNCLDSHDSIKEVGNRTKRRN